MAHRQHAGKTTTRIKTNFENSAKKYGVRTDHSVECVHPSLLSVTDSAHFMHGGHEKAARNKLSYIRREGIKTCFTFKKKMTLSRNPKGIYLNL